MIQGSKGEVRFLHPWTGSMTQDDKGLQEGDK
jgi:hypothetical protein